MNKTWLIAMALVPYFIAMLLTGCSSAPAVEPYIIAVVQRGGLEVRAGVDGHIETPAAVNLYFDTTMFTPPFSSKIKRIYVEKGDMVRAGALLAKLDDTTQKLAVEAAQYALELAINNVVQTVCLGRVPSFGYEEVTLKRFEFAQKEMEKAQVFLLDGRYEESSGQIALAKLDLEGARAFYSDPAYPRLRTEFAESSQLNYTADIEVAVARLTAEIDKLSLIQQQYRNGQYMAARGTVQDIMTEMGDTWSLVRGLNRVRDGVDMPDTGTAYTVLNEVLLSLDKLDVMSGQKDFDRGKYAETLNLARHDLELSKKIIDENVSTLRLGLNLKVLRDYNIAIQSAIINLDRAKQVLLKTELIAPFDGRVEDINLRAGDMIAQRYSTTGAPIDSYVIRLADTSYLRMTGVVDEIDAVNIKAGQRAVIYIDAMPGERFDGTVKFISKFGPQQANSIQYYGTMQPTAPAYRVEIEIDKQQSAGLYNGMSASAEIHIDSRSEVLTIPNSALAGKAGDYMVRVLVDEKDNIFEQRPVKVGLQAWSQSEIVSGLKEGEKVLVERVGTPPRQLNIKK